MQYVVRTYYNEDPDSLVVIEIVDSVVNQKGQKVVAMTTSESEKLLLPAYPGDVFLGLSTLVEEGYAIVAVCDRCDTKKGREIVVDDSMVAKGNWLIGFKTKQK